MRLRTALVALTTLLLAACQNQGGGGGQAPEGGKARTAPNQLRSVGVATPSVSSPKHPTASPAARAGKPLAPSQAGHEAGKK